MKGIVCTVLEIQMFGYQACHVCAQTVNEATQMAATQLISEIHERYRMYRFRNSNVWLPSLSCLRPVRTCFTVTCPRLDENNGINFRKRDLFLPFLGSNYFILDNFLS